MHSPSIDDFRHTHIFLGEAHERNDEVLERIYIGRRFRNDTERLEKLFELYTAMSTDKQSPRNRTGQKTAT